jgi:hypothetical protein
LFEAFQVPDILDHQIVNLPDATITVNRFAVEFQIVDSQTQQQLILDRRGGNRLVWPTGLASLTVTERRRVIEAAIREWIAIEMEKLG